MTDEQLSALLRLKRYETPPPGYFDRLLTEVHRRQRAELLRQPLWKIALERFQTFFGEHSMGPISYAGAVASVVAAAALGMGAFNTWSGHQAQVLAAATPTEQALRLARAPVPEPPAFAPQLATLTGQAGTQVGSEATGRQAPRYVIDARPVSYEAPSAF